VLEQTLWEKHQVIDFVNSLFDIRTKHSSDGYGIEPLPYHLTL